MVEENSSDEGFGGQQARLLKILVWFLAIHAGFGFLVMVALGLFGVMGFLASREAAMGMQVHGRQACPVSGWRTNPEPR